MTWENDTCGFALNRLRCELSEIDSLVRLLEGQPRTKKIDDLIDEDAKESIWAYLGGA